MDNVIIEPTEGLSTDFRFPKSQKLCGDKPVGELFDRGSAFSRFPLRVVFLLCSERFNGEEPLRMMVSVGKKRFKRAVKRNRVKRLVRESYRLRKQQLQDALESNYPGAALHVAFVFLDKEMPDYAKVDTAMRQSLAKLRDLVAERKLVPYVREPKNPMPADDAQASNAESR